MKELKEKFDLIQVVRTSSIFHNKPDWEKGTKTIPDLREKPDWMSEELAFLQECNDQCNLRFASVRNAPDANMQVSLFTIINMTFKNDHKKWFKVDVQKQSKFRHKKFGKLNLLYFLTFNYQNYLCFLLDFFFNFFVFSFILDIF